MNTKLHVGNLPFSATALELQGLFAQAGAVAAIDLVTDRMTGRSRGFAFVTMATPEEASAAIAALHGHPLDGRNLTVSEARPAAEGAAGPGGRKGGRDARPGGGRQAR